MSGGSREPGIERTPVFGAGDPREGSGVRSGGVLLSRCPALIRRVTLVGAGGTTHRTGATPYGADGYAPAEPIDVAIRGLQSIVVPPFPAVADEGLDGTTYGVEREQLGAAARLQWWERPRLWETLAAWHDRTRTLLDGYLPAPRTPQS